MKSQDGRFREWQWRKTHGEHRGQRDEKMKGIPQPQSFLENNLKRERRVHEPSAILNSSNGLQTSKQKRCIVGD